MAVVEILNEVGNRDVFEVGTYGVSRLFIIRKIIRDT